MRCSRTTSETSKRSNQRHDRTPRANCSASLVNMGARVRFPGRVRAGACCNNYIDIGGVLAALRMPQG